MGPRLRGAGLRLGLQAFRRFFNTLPRGDDAAGGALNRGSGNIGVSDRPA